LVKIIFYESKKLNRNVLLFYLVALGPDDDIVDVAAPEAFDIAGQTLYQQTITEFEWEEGMLYQLRHKYFLPFEALLLVSDIIRNSYDRNVVRIQV
jgi:hypothetical protein